MNDIKDSLDSIVTNYPKDWEIKTLGDMGTFLRGKGISKSETVDSGIPCVMYGEIYTQHQYFIKRFSSFINRDVANKSERVFKGDLLFAGSGETMEEIGKSVALLSDVEAYAGGDIVIFRPNNVNSLYLSYTLNNGELAIERAKLGQGHSVVHIYPKDLQHLKIPLPSKVEQQKIASILSTWDKAIELKEKLIEQKKEQKKGLMQKLLTGHIRWNDCKVYSREELNNRRLIIEKGDIPGGYKKTKIGIIPEDWEMKSIKDIAKINSKSLSGNTKDDFQFYYYDLSSVNEGVINHPSEKIAYCFSPSRARRIFGESDILMSTVRPNLKGFAYVDFNSENCVASTGFAVISTNEKVDSKLIYHSLFSGTIENQINKLLVGSNYPAINSTDVENLKIAYPLCLEEREKITTIITTCDTELNLLANEITELRLQKKGLMQNLLTGKIRVKV